MDLDALTERMDRLEAENRSLREALGRLHASPQAALDAAPVDAAVPVSRRALLGRAGAGALALGAVAAAGVTIVRPETTRAGGPVPLYANVDNDATATTSITNATNDENVFAATSQGSGTGVGGYSQTGIGVQGASDSSTGVDGYSVTGEGVFGFSFTGAGVRGQTDNGVAVQGVGNLGRGGRFSGQKAAVQLQAGGRSSHPSSGSRGDLYVDRTGRLWYCKGGTTWRQLA